MNYFQQSVGLPDYTSRTSNQLVSRHEATLCCGLAVSTLNVCDAKGARAAGKEARLSMSCLALQDKKKVEADEPVFGLASVDLVEVEEPTWHIAQHLPSIRWVTPLLLLLHAFIPLYPLTQQFVRCYSSAMHSPCNCLPVRSGYRRPCDTGMHNAMSQQRRTVQSSLPPINNNSMWKPCHL